MSNLPGFDLADFFVNTWSKATVANIKLWNDAWDDIESGKFEFKNWAASLAKCYRNNFEAFRDIATFDVKSVEWQQRTIRRDVIENFTFKVAARVGLDSVQVSKMDRIGGDERGSVDIQNVGLDRGQLTIKVLASGAVEVGDQWIGFAYDKINGGPPLGVLLAMIGPP
jgi:hypothetical protein